MNGLGRSHDATILVVDDEPDLKALVLQNYARYGEISVAGGTLAGHSKRNLIAFGTLPALDEHPNE
jgi:hypothetical protein